MQTYSVMNITNGNVVATFETREEAEEWIEDQDIPQMYEIMDES